MIHSEPPTNAAFNIQQTPVNITNTYKYNTNTNGVATHVSYNKSSKESNGKHSGKQSLIIHEDGNTMHFIDSDNKNQNISENYIDYNEAKAAINDRRRNM